MGGSGRFVRRNDGVKTFRSSQLYGTGGTINLRIHHRVIPCIVGANWSYDAVAVICRFQISNFCVWMYCGGVIFKSVKTLTTGETKLHLPSEPPGNAKTPCDESQAPKVYRAAVHCE